MDQAVRVLRGLAWQNDGVVTRERAAAAGVSGRVWRTLVRDGRVRELARGVGLVDADRCALSPRGLLRAGLAAYGERAVAVLHSAAHVHGMRGVPRVECVHVATPDTASRRGGPGIVAHRQRLRSDEIVTVDGFPVTTPVRTLADLVPRLPAEEGLAVLDSALHLGLVGAEELVAVERAVAGRPGAGRVRPLLAIADARSESPLESRVRLDCVRGGVAPDALQHEVALPGGGRARVDLAWLTGLRPVFAEADGADAHSRPDALFRDRARANELALEGALVLRFTWHDTLRRGRVAALVRRAFQA
ncbi:hypothetical protein [Embleya sp. NBC_00896]|uniref:hypothetical protein n=1 Tax=Embleya sp. NBC_00896 TaxID=2975961 RepID=UPI00386E380C|nr:endonuclease domain-containing protein [Embleya sp. NBC_00896]